MPRWTASPARYLRGAELPLPARSTLRHAAADDLRAWAATTVRYKLIALSYRSGAETRRALQEFFGAAGALPHHRIYPGILSLPRAGSFYKYADCNEPPRGRLFLLSPNI